MVPKPTTHYSWQQRPWELELVNELNHLLLPPAELSCPAVLELNSLRNRQAIQSESHQQMNGSAALILWSASVASWPRHIYK